MVVEALFIFSKHKTMKVASYSLYCHLTTIMTGKEKAYITVIPVHTYRYYIIILTHTTCILHLNFHSVAPLVPGMNCFKGLLGMYH